MTLKVTGDAEMINAIPATEYVIWIKLPIAIPTAVQIPDWREYTNEFLMINTKSGPGVNQAKTCTARIVLINTRLSILSFY